MLTIFALPKPFKGIYKVIQRNAIFSWTLLKPEVEIILFEDEEGTTKEISRKFNTAYVPNVEKNEFGTPLISYLFEKAHSLAKNDILCYVNCDIILMSDFIEVIEKIKEEKNFLMVGQRVDLDVKEEINFEDPNWEKGLRKKAQKQGNLHPSTGIDYFVFRKGLWDKIPSFAVGKLVWDEWLLWKAWKDGAKIIDATKVITAIHQNHPYLTKNGKKFDPLRTEEAKTNLGLAGGYGHCLTIKDATHILTDKGLKKAPGMGIIRKLELLPYLGVFVRQRKKLWKRKF